VVKREGPPGIARQPRASREVTKDAGSLRAPEGGQTGLHAWRALISLTVADLR
jgi:hypothetical protein